MVQIHVLDGAALSRDDGLRAREIEEKFGGRQRRGLGEAAVQVSGFRREREEAEIGKVRVELRLRMAGEEALTGSRLARLARAPRHGKARVGKRIALAALAEQERASGI